MQSKKIYVNIFLFIMLFDILFVGSLLKTPEIEIEANNLEDASTNLVELPNEKFNTVNYYSIPQAMKPILISQFVGGTNTKLLYQPKGTTNIIQGIGSVGLEGFKVGDTTLAPSTNTLNDLQLATNPSIELPQYNNLEFAVMEKTKALTLSSIDNDFLYAQLTNLRGGAQPSHTIFSTLPRVDIAPPYTSYLDLILCNRDGFIPEDASYYSTPTKFHLSAEYGYFGSSDENWVLNKFDQRIKSPYSISFSQTYSNWVNNENSAWFGEPIDSLSNYIVQMDALIYNECATAPRAFLTHVTGASDIGSLNVIRNDFPRYELDGTRIYLSNWFNPQASKQWGSADAYDYAAHSITLQFDLDREYLREGVEITGYTFKLGGYFRANQRAIDIQFLGATGDILHTSSYTASKIPNDAIFNIIFSNIEGVSLKEILLNTYKINVKFQTDRTGISDPQELAIDTVHLTYTVKADYSSQALVVYDTNIPTALPYSIVLDQFLPQLAFGTSDFKGGKWGFINFPYNVLEIDPLLYSVERSAEWGYKNTLTQILTGDNLIANPILSDNYLIYLFIAKSSKQIEPSPVLGKISLTTNTFEYKAQRQIEMSNLYYMVKDQSYFYGYLSVDIPKTESDTYVILVNPYKIDVFFSLIHELVRVSSNKQYVLTEGTSFNTLTLLKGGGNWDIIGIDIEYRIPNRLSSSYVNKIEYRTAFPSHYPSQPEYVIKDISEINNEYYFGQVGINYSFYLDNWGTLKMPTVRGTGFSRALSSTFSSDFIPMGAEGLSDVELIYDTSGWIGANAIGGIIIENNYINVVDYQTTETKQIFSVDSLSDTDYRIIGILGKNQPYGLQKFANETIDIQSGNIFFHNITTTSQYIPTITQVKNRPLIPIINFTFENLALTSKNIEIDSIQLIPYTNHIENQYIFNLTFSETVLIGGNSILEMPIELNFSESKLPDQDSIYRIYIKFRELGEDWNEIYTTMPIISEGDLRNYIGDISEIQISDVISGGEEYQSEFQFDKVLDTNIACFYIVNTKGLGTQRDFGKDTTIFSAYRFPSQQPPIISVISPLDSAIITNTITSKLEINFNIESDYFMEENTEIALVGDNGDFIELEFDVKEQIGNIYVCNSSVLMDVLNKAKYTIEILSIDDFSNFEYFDDSVFYVEKYIQLPIDFENLLQSETVISTTQLTVPSKLIVNYTTTDLPEEEQVDFSKYSGFFIDLGTSYNDANSYKLQRNALDIFYPINDPSKFMFDSGRKTYWKINDYSQNDTLNFNLVAPTAQLELDELKSTEYEKHYSIILRRHQNIRTYEMPKIRIEIPKHYEYPRFELWDETGGFFKSITLESNIQEGYTTGMFPKYYVQFTVPLILEGVDHRFRIIVQNAMVVSDQGYYIEPPTEPIEYWVGALIGVVFGIIVRIGLPLIPSLANKYLKLRLDNKSTQDVIKALILPSIIGAVVGALVFPLF